MSKREVYRAAIFLAALTLIAVMVWLAQKHPLLG